MVHTKQYITQKKAVKVRNSKKDTRHVEDKMADANSTILINTLNMNVLNTQSNDRDCQAVFKIQPYAVHKAHFRFIDTNRLKVKGQKKICKQ